MQSNTLTTDNASPPYISRHLPRDLLAGRLSLFRVHNFQDLVLCDLLVFRSFEDLCMTIFSIRTYILITTPFFHPWFHWFSKIIAFLDFVRFVWEDTSFGSSSRSYQHMMRGHRHYNNPSKLVRNTTNATAWLVKNMQQSWSVFELNSTK